MRSHNRKLSLCKAGLLIFAQEGCALQSSLPTLERKFGGVKVWHKAQQNRRAILNVWENTPASTHFRGHGMALRRKLG